MIADVILSSNMVKAGHFSDGISLENGNDFDKNNICNDWTETFCEYNIEYKLDGSVCHLSEMDE